MDTNLDKPWRRSVVFIPPPNTRVTQAELEECKRLERLERETSEQLRASRRSIREKLENNAAVEPGRFSVHLSQCESRRFSYQKLTDLVGERTANDLRDRIEPTIVTRVEIYASF